MDIKYSFISSIYPESYIILAFSFIEFVLFVKNINLPTPNFKVSMLINVGKFVGVKQFKCEAKSLVYGYIMLFLIQLKQAAFEYTDGETVGVILGVNVIVGVIDLVGRGDDLIGQRPTNLYSIATLVFSTSKTSVFIKTKLGDAFLKNE